MLTIADFAAFDWEQVLDVHPKKVIYEVEDAARRKAYEFDEARLAMAIAATFERRRTAIPSGVPDALTPEFARDASEQRQWDAFVRELAAGPDSLETVVSDLAAFLMPMAVKARASTRN
jgi:hypothetical protein